MDSGLIQSLAVTLIVLAAGLFLARRAWRIVSASRRASAEGTACGASGACGCESTAKPVEHDALTRRG